MSLQKLLAGTLLISALAGCSTPNIYSKKQDPQTSIKLEKIDLDYMPFANKGQFEEALAYFRVGQVTNGFWKGLPLRKIKNNPREIGKFVDPNDPYIKFVKRNIYENFPDFDTFSTDRKVEEAYKKIKIAFSYQQNPFDMLEQVNKKKMPYDLWDRTEGEFLGVQHVGDICNFWRGDCEDLAIVLTSCLRSVGVKSAMIYLQGTDPAAHVISCYWNEEASQDKLRFVDATRKDKSLKENSEKTLRSLWDQKVTYICLIP